LDCSNSSINLKNARHAEAADTASFILGLRRGLGLISALTVAGRARNTLSNTEEEIRAELRRSRRKDMVTLLRECAKSADRDSDLTDNTVAVAIYKTSARFLAVAARLIEIEYI
jgi:hypothetical protein